MLTLPSRPYPLLPNHKTALPILTSIPSLCPPSPHSSSEKLQAPPLLQGVLWLLILEMLPVIATAVTSVAYRMPGGAQVRVLSLFSSPLWLIYNACNGSIGGVISDSLSILSIFAGMYKHDRKKKG